MINKKADKIQNNEEQEKNPSRIQYVQRLNKLVLLLHTYVKINKRYHKSAMISSQCMLCHCSVKLNGFKSNSVKMRD